MINGHLAWVDLPPPTHGNRLQAEAERTGGLMMQMITSAENSGWQSRHWSTKG
jgi:hypothetical protein